MRQCSPEECYYNENKRKKAFLILNYLLYKKVSLNIPTQDSINESVGWLVESTIDDAIEYKLISFLAILIPQAGDLNIKNKFNETYLDIVKKKAMNKVDWPRNRIIYYKMCTMLENAGAESSVELQPMPSEEAMKEEARRILITMDSRYFFPPKDL